MRVLGMILPQNTTEKRVVLAAVRHHFEAIQPLLEQVGLHQAQLKERRVVMGEIILDVVAVVVQTPLEVTDREQMAETEAMVLHHQSQVRP